MHRYDIQLQGTIKVELIEIGQIWDTIGGIFNVEVVHYAPLWRTSSR